MLTSRRASVAYVALVVTAMSGVIGLTMTALHQGFASGLLQAWLHDWPMAFAVALPAAWLILPGMRILLARWTRPDQPMLHGRHAGGQG